ncbi:hypothetical protein B0T16DRAFT_11190 [Cercophora newfieldiana]|uniref:Uncharacterized protein n=1 Tax=Cercophora newfieldiana TaxID=92897 RepID=A0AA39YPM4_9PEZI|nr:hypothetical protein B0T16DRAFT_11190 [Cercophora newfieldiana]
MPFTRFPRQDAGWVQARCWCQLISTGPANTQPFGFNRWELRPQSGTRSSRHHSRWRHRHRHPPVRHLFKVHQNFLLCGGIGIGIPLSVPRNTVLALRGSLPKAGTSHRVEAQRTQQSSVPVSTPLNRSSTLPGPPGYTSQAPSSYIRPRMSSHGPPRFPRTMLTRLTATGVSESASEGGVDA